MTGADVQAKFTALVGQYGESVTLDRGGDDRSVKMLLEPANSAVVATYFDDDAAVGLVRPCVQACFDATMSGTNPGGGTGPQAGNSSGPPEINDTFTRDGRPFTIQKIQFHRLGDVVVLITCLCD